MINLQPLSLFGSWFAGAGEIAIVFSMTALLIGVVVFSFFFYRKKQREEHKKLMKEKYQKYLLKLNLSPIEESYIRSLVKLLGNEELNYHMLTDRRTFAACADKLAKLKDIPKGLREGIEKKLNFPVKTVEVNYFSSEDLPPGMPALLIFDETKKISAVIKENDRSAITLRTKKALPPIPAGTRLSVYFHDNQKIFTINTTILEQNENLVTVSHSLLQSQKRRAFKRKKVKLPVVIKHLDFEEIPIHSYITDLSEGGASLENPDFAFKKHDMLLLYYHIETEEGFQIRGEVLRLSAKGRMIHIKFLDKDLTLRSRIKTIIK